MAFVEAQEILITPKRLADANLLFEGRGWPAVPHLEVPLAAVQPMPAAQVQRIAWQAPDLSWQVFLGAAQITVRCNPLQIQDSPPPAAQFYEQAAVLMETLLAHYGLVASRLATRVQGWVAATSIPDPQGLTGRLFRPIPGPGRKSTGEWTWNNVTCCQRDFGEMQEEVNEIFSLRHFGKPAAFLNGEPIPGVDLTLEFNTHPARTEPRFSAPQTAAFFRSLPGWDRGLRADLLSVIS